MTETKLKLADWLDDLSVRFIINLPIEELVSVERICFQIEEAHWFYEDFLRPLDPALPNMHLKQFCNLMFHHCPLLGNIDTATAAKAYDEFLAYKQRVPVRGAILLNDDMSEVVLVRGLKKSARWSFPRGKINKEETDFDCAIREVYEETGFDVRAAGLDDEDTARSIDLSIRDQQMKMYMIRGVPMDTHFAPRTRGEIGDIKWFKLSDLPTNRNRRQEAQQQQQAVKAQGMYNDNMFYVVAPFLNPLKSWIKGQRKLDKSRARAVSGYATAGTDFEDVGTADEGAIFSGNDTAFEDTLAPPPVKPANGHFGGLLAGLRNSSTVTPKATPQEMPTEQSPMDPAAALKRMLSVGGVAPMQAPSQTQSNASALLSIFNGGQSANQPIPPAGSHIPPHTPLDQIVNVPPQPRSPTHHHQAQRPQVATSAQGPPPYPFTPVTQQFPQQNFAYQSQALQPPQNHPSHHPSLSNTAPIPTTRGPPYPQTAGPPVLPQQGPAPHYVQGGPQPFHRIGDPQFTQMPFENSDARAVPSASQLPLPKLNNHSMNLLKAFTSGDSKPQGPRLEDTAQRAAEAYNKRIAEQQNVTSPEAQLARNLAALTSAKSPPGNSPVPVMSPEQAPSQPQRQQQGSTHQNSLLNLFRTPSAAAAALAAPPPIKVPQGSEPIELSAQPSPGFPPVARAQAGGPVRQTYASKLGVPPTNAGANVKPGLTSATISGPLNAPDFGKFKQKNRASPSAEANGVGSSHAGPSANNASVLGGTTSFSPVSILRRPQAADAGLLTPKSPDVPVHTVSPKTVLEQPAPRQFKPQILKRSQQTPSPAPVAQAQSTVPPPPQGPQQQVPQQQQMPFQHQLPHHHQQQVQQQQQQMPPPAKPSLQHPLHSQVPQHQTQAPPSSSQNPLFDRRTTTQTTQKSSLLSLFNSSPAPTSTSAATTSTATAHPPSRQPNQALPPPITQPSHPQHAFSVSGIMSPISPLPEKMALGLGASHGAGAGSFGGKSRISSLNSTSEGLSTMGLGHEMNDSFTSAVSATSAPGSNIGLGGPGGGNGAGLASGRQSVSASARGSTQHTPVTPVDRSFLLGYLQNVVEQAKK